MATTITEKDVLSFYGLTKPPYSAQKKSTSMSRTKYAEAKDKDNFDDGEWIISKDGKPVDPSKFLSNNATYNKCSIVGAEKGIIITDKKKFIDNKNKGSSGSNSASTNSTETMSSIDMSTMGSDGATVQGWIEAVDFSPKGHDEEIVQKLQFAKACLIKECYEWVGINLSNNIPKNPGKTDYWN